MQKIAQKLILVFLTVTTLASAGCETCGQTKTLADLLFRAASFVVPEITLVQSFVINNVIENLAPSCEADGSDTAETAEDSNKGISAEYRPDGNGTWQDAQLAQDGIPTYQVILATDDLASGETDESQEAFQFTTPGQYRFKYDTDVVNVIEERNEANNSAAVNNGNISGKKEGNDIIVTVTDPTGKRQPQYNSRQVVTINYLGTCKITQIGRASCRERV